MSAVEATADQIDAFRAALAQQLVGADRASLIAELGITRNALQKWLAGETEPKRNKVFALERLLEVPPGALSVHLGYLPPDARDVQSALDAIEHDTTLSKKDRGALVRLYRGYREG